jgi:RNA polymerase II subunit A-like phosphatase
MSHKKKIVSSTLVSTSTVTTLNNSSKMDASVRIVHAEPKIRVSETEALEIGKKDLMNLVKNKKLVLLVDLDHTLIHTTNENVRADLKVRYFILISLKYT